MNQYRLMFNSFLPKWKQVNEIDTIVGWHTKASRSRQVRGWALPDAAVKLARWERRKDKRIVSIEITSADYFNQSDQKWHSVDPSVIDKANLVLKGIEKLQ